MAQKVCQKVCPVHGKDFGWCVKAVGLLLWIFPMKRIVLLIIMLFSLSMISLADNARLDALRETKQDVNETAWAFTGFSVPLLIGGWYMTGGTTSGTITYSVFAPSVVVGMSQYYPISPRADRFLGKSPAYVSAYVDVYESEVRSLRRQFLLGGFVASVGSLIILNSMDIL